MAGLAPLGGAARFPRRAVSRLNMQRHGGCTALEDGILCPKDLLGLGWVSNYAWGVVEQIGVNPIFWSDIFDAQVVDGSLTGSAARSKLVGCLEPCLTRQRDRNARAGITDAPSPRRVVTGSSTGSCTVVAQLKSGQVQDVKYFGVEMV